MSIRTGLFREFHQDSRPLSLHLDRVYGDVARRRVGELGQEDLQRDVADLVAELIDEVRVQPPRLLGADAASTGEGLARPVRDPGVRAATSRHFVAIQVSGEARLLEHWPDEVSDALTPVDSIPGVPATEPGRSDPYDYEWARAQHELDLARQRWFISRRDESGPAALFTFEDLTAEEEEDVLEGRLNPRDAIDDRRRSIEPIVAAIAVQARDYFDRRLPEELAELIRRRSRRLAARSAVRESLTWPIGWKFDEPKVVESEADGVDTQSEAGAEIVLEHRPRLAPVTFADVQRTIRVWADAVERYPAAFSPLLEDRLSDLLAATLNASLPGAGREVYTRGGKSDLFIRADVLSEGYGPAKIFICESKWWRGPATVNAELDQLLGYLEAKDTAAVLLYFVRNQNPGEVRPTAVEVVQGRPDFVRDEPTLVDGWPLVGLEREGRQVSVCLAFIDLPSS